MAPGFADDDPLSRVLAPPPNETAADREARLLAETEAKRISDAIDEELQLQARSDKKGPRPMKMLLLGQSESGKSTTLKNFQLLHSPKAFHAERASWRAVIQLNVVRSIRLILEAIAEVHALQVPSASSSPRSSHRTLPDSRPSSSRSSPLADLPHLTPEHLKLRLRLMPLLQVEEVLIRKLTRAGNTEQEATRLTQLTNMPDVIARDKELAVNSHFVWKTMFSRIAGKRNSSEMDIDAIDWNDPEDAGRIIHACGEDMIMLWGDPVVHDVLAYQKLRLQEMPGFFLDSLDRLTEPRYIPTDDDILRARLKTLGVSEYRFQVKDENFSGIVAGSREWRVYDVGGHRSLRAAWAPFFDDMDAVLFLAPISCFDQVLEEDPLVNRLEDSVLLWKSIVSNPLLARTSLVLFLNKIDILQHKLSLGIQLGHYIVSYGNRPNDYQNTSTYLRRKFSQIHKEHSPVPRPFYCHFTAVTDTKTTAHILGDVQDTIVRRQLQSIALMGPDL
ncbi:G-alpha-domain-containing protein [Phanerochaete sordida]|uniref:G-alpha-domain-containing protein n=1 Tax=Phanerochaete sordida TaxID=48140 RepID=A0A9P3L9X3_9APHY|nr:G-alpha-domain-containing protein [Phanerochaete sordida]